MECIHEPSFSGPGFCVDTRVRQACPSRAGVPVLEETLGQEADSACDVTAAPRALWEQREVRGLALGREEPDQSVESRVPPDRQGEQDLQANRIAHA